VSQIVVMPKIGLTATEAELATWLVEVGDEVSEGDLLCEIETDKITNEVESPASGVLLKRLEAGVIVPVGQPIAVLGEPGEDVGSVRLYAPGGEPAAEPTQSFAPQGASEAPRGEGGQFVKASPAARRRAKELGVPLEEMTGSGPGGRVTLEDVESFDQRRGHR
jgi:pyruvate/2-oxoglutarate dehydrogenase complex dihydrolipoamide acyltransferase (E2) component